MPSPDHDTHAEHSHVHGPDCGHLAIRHDDHVCYVHDGHLHHPHEDHVDEHRIAASDVNPVEHTDAASGHDAGHAHGPGCGHEAVPHDSHTDFLVAGRLHHPHGDHCDDHGPVELVA